MIAERDYLAEVTAARDEAGRAEERARRSMDETEARIDRFIEDWNERDESPYAALRFDAWRKKAELLESGLVALHRKAYPEESEPKRKSAATVGWSVVGSSSPLPPRVAGAIEFIFVLEPDDDFDVEVRLFVAKRTGLIAQQPPGAGRLEWKFSYETLVPHGIPVSSLLSRSPVAAAVDREWTQDWPQPGEGS